MWFLSESGATEIGLLSEGRSDELADCLDGMAAQVNAWKDKTLAAGRAVSGIFEDSFELFPEFVEEESNLLPWIVGVHQANRGRVRARRRIVEWATALETAIEVVHPDGACRVAVVSRGARRDGGFDRAIHGYDA